LLRLVSRLGEVILSEPNSNYWIVKFTTNRLLAVTKSRAISKEYTVSTSHQYFHTFYQALNNPNLSKPANSLRISSPTSVDVNTLT